MRITRMKTKDIKFAPYNPRTITEEMLERLKQSIQRWGYVEPIIVNQRTGWVVGGNQRLKALRELGIDEVEVILVDLTEEEEKALNVALNRISGEWDEELLAQVIADITQAGIDPLLTGFTTEELETLLEKIPQEQKEDKKADQLPNEVPRITKRGDLWILGRHRLLCGDATNTNDIERLMQGEKATMVLTDPPYGMHLDTDYSTMDGGKTYRQVIGDHDDFTPALITTIFQHFNDAREIFLWGADFYAEYIPEVGRGSWIVWDKMDGGRITIDQYEKQYGNNFELAWSREPHEPIIIRYLWKGFYGLQKEDTGKRIHPTQKPVGMLQEFIRRWGQEGDIVVDLYGGSGSTLIACEKEGVSARLMELDPEYVDLIVQRYLNYTGNEDSIKLVRDGQEYNWKEVKQDG